MKLFSGGVGELCWRRLNYMSSPKTEHAFADADIVLF